MDTIEGLISRPEVLHESIYDEQKLDKLVRSSIIWTRQDVAGIFALLASIASILFAILVVFVVMATKI